MEIERKEKKDDNNQDNGGQIYTDGFYAGVAFANTRPYYFHTYDESIVKGTDVVVETVRGVELGHVVIEATPVEKMKTPLSLKPIIRIATSLDLQNYQENLKLAVTAHDICKGSIANFKLEMNLLKTEYTLDRSKIIFLYVADNRVDFRELLKDLAAKLKCRIELRQIGTRDRSKLIGGIGSCGLPLCCSSFLGEFDGISINMAKNQFLALNIQKLSGHCGKLICCLKYEDEQYSEIRKGLPKIGLRIKYEDSLYKITSINVLTGQVRLENPEDTKVAALKDVQKIVNKMKENENGKQ